MAATLYQYWLSSCSWRVRWALGIKRIPFDSVVVDLGAGEQLTPEHRARNPMGRVPALVIDGICLAESVAILEYLEETRPDPAIYPKDPKARARCRQIVEIICAGIQPIQNGSVAKFHAADAEGQKKWVVHFNERGLSGLEQLCQALSQEPAFAGPYALGAQLTAADLCIVPQLYSARRFGVDVSGFKRLLAIEANALATEHAQAALPQAPK